ncbi:MAG: M20/M25/M40 family metallo-hydrolase [Acidobacteriota bacterium]|nr:M20/M25/M40 family metallo-hydrolase [Acidobacteriota bacterium]
MLTRLLGDLVSIDSVNPDLVPGAKGEAAVAAHCAAWLSRAGLDVEVQEAAPGRPNVVGVLEGSKPGRTLMLCGHIDTVGVEGMAAPFTPEVRDGRLYGRGAQDMKGGVAAMMEAARRAKDRWTSGRLVIACVCDEEYESIGAQALVTRWTADAAVVTEPTDLSVAVTHKGFAWIALETMGRAAHGSRPAEGRDAILRMGRVLSRLDALNRDLSVRQADPLTGPPSLHASTIGGGREWSSYPDHCALTVERRTVAGETEVLVMEEIEAILQELRAEDAEFAGTARLVASRAPYALDPAHELPVTLAGLAKARGATAGIAGMSFWTDAAILGGAGIPSVLFGPGGAGLHSIEEYVTLSEVEDCAVVLEQLALGYCAAR